MSNLIRSPGRLSLHSGGSMMLNIIVIIVIFASLISAVVYMSSSSLRQALSFNQSTNAWNCAEGCYRFLTTKYSMLSDTNANFSVDDERVAFLRNVDKSTYVIPNNCSFTLGIRPYWFYNAGAQTTQKLISVQLPGTAPANFAMPGTGWVKVGDSPGVGIKSYTGGVFTSGTGAFACTLASKTTLNPGDSVYLVLYPNANKTLTPGSDLTLNLATFSATAFPARDGFIEIGSETRLYRYKYAQYDILNPNILTLHNLQYAVQRTVASENTFSTPVTAATTVTFKKYITAQCRGQVGPEQRTLSFNQAILDNLAASSAPPLKLKLDQASGPNSVSANFTQSSSITSSSVQTLQTSGGGSSIFSCISGLTKTTGSGNDYKCGAYWYNGTSTINQQWAPPPPSTNAGNYSLSYDIQVKPATGNTLKFGTIGLAIRAKKVSSPTEPDTYLGLTFMKYDLPNLYFNRQTGTTAINPGDTIVGATSHVTGIVQGTPEITSGSWAGGNAAGKIRFASVNGPFSADEWLTVGGVNRVRVNGSNYFAAATTDYIPNAIKPKPSDFTSFPGNPFYSSRYNIGPLLLVLWERKADGTFRWLAFKDISNDVYTKGLQDWVEPNGSCTNPPSSCNGSDGQIINDMASIYVRVQEKRVVLGSGSAVKVNDINLFYGDYSSRYVAPTWPARPGNDIPYDIKDLRRRYTTGDASIPDTTQPFNPIWVPQYISQWEQKVDFFSHIESGTPPQFQWDAINPNVADISVLKICDDASAACTSTVNGTLRLTELVTPDSGTYNQPEVGMFACGNLTQTYDTCFAEVALQIFAPGGTGATGGFFGTSFSW